jgi:hypothetical protein
MYSFNFTVPCGHGRVASWVSTQSHTKYYCNIFLLCVICKCTLMLNQLLRHLPLFQLALNTLWLREEEDGVYKHICFDACNLTSCELFAECNFCVSQGVPAYLQAVCGLHDATYVNSVLGNKFLLISLILKLLNILYLFVSHGKINRTL